MGALATTRTNAVPEWLIWLPLAVPFLGIVLMLSFWAFKQSRRSRADNEPDTNETGAPADSATAEKTKLEK